MKKLKKLTVLGIAAALMVISCAAAVVTGLDQRLIDFLGGGELAQELLAPGTVSEGVTVEDNGAVLHVSQVLMDRYSILILADFTAPEGTVLDMGGRGSAYFGELDFYLLDESGIQIPEEWLGNRSIIYKVLEDEDALDNHLTLLFNMLISEGFQRDWNVSKFHLPIENIAYVEKTNIVSVYDGNWSCDIPLPQQDIGQSWQVDMIAGTLDDVNIRLKEIYLSPMTLQFALEREVPIKPEDIDETAEEGIYFNWMTATNNTSIDLKDRDGQIIPLIGVGGMIDNHETSEIYRLSEITDLEQLSGGTLTLRIGGGSVDIPLDGLTPVE